MAAASEFSRPFAVDGLRDGAAQVKVAAEPEERARLAQRFDLVAIDSLVASFNLRLSPLGEVEVDGRLEAEVVQRCVVSLEAVPARVVESFELRFAADAPPPVEDLSFGPGEEEPAEPLEGGEIDLGEVAAQQLSLALEPYPRAPGARIGASSVGRAGGAPAGPFAALSALKGERKKGH